MQKAPAISHTTTVAASRFVSGPGGRATEWEGSGSGADACEEDGGGRLMEVADDGSDGGPEGGHGAWMTEEGEGGEGEVEGAGGQYWHEVQPEDRRHWQALGKLGDSC